MDARRDLNTALIAKSRTSFLGHIALAILTGLTALPAVEKHWVFWPLGLIILLNSCRAILQATYAKHFHRKADVAWYYIYGSLTLGGAILWGVMGAELIHIHGKSDDLSILVMVIMAGLASGATSTLTPDKNLARLFVLGCILPAIGVIIHLGDFSYASLGVVIFFYLLFLMAQINVHSNLFSELANRRSQLRAFEDATLEAIIVHDNGTILEVNPSFEKMFLYDEADAIGTNIFTFVAEEERPRYQNQPFEDKSKPTQVTGKRKDGTTFPIEVVGRWFTYGNRKVRVTCIQDVTARVEAEAAIREREQIALESAKTKSLFLANMSHEIRTPLNAIIGVTDLLNDTAVSDLQKKYFRTLKESGEALLGLVNDILDFSKIDENRLDLEIIDFSLAAAIEGQTELLANRARQKNISLEVMLDPQLPLKVSGDYGRFGQVILNLVSNAIKFTAQGSVRVSAKVLDLSGQEVRVRLEVKDTGVGIPVDSRERLFNPFTQADSSTARKYGGTGLGLSISKRIVELMHGTIGFETEVNKGTTFWFEIKLPVIQAEPLAHQYMHKPHDGKKIVVVTDQMDIRDVLTCYLESWQFSIEFKELNSLDDFDGRVVIVASGNPLEGVLSKLKNKGYEKHNVVVIESGGEHSHQQNPLVKVSLPLPVRYSDLFNAINEMSVEYFQKQSLMPGPLHEVFKNRRVLVAEDNSTNQMIILAFLRHYGLQCHAVGNGIEVVDAFSSGGYDLILMDCQMPELDGFEATKRIRQIEVNKGSTPIPIVALTANALKEDRDRCFESGMDDFLSKPIRKEKLVESLERFLLQEKIKYKASV
jgi:PAS domain S-box